jgi:pimeloyl-ACP methyl ester carboxylesterase
MAQIAYKQGARAIADIMIPKLLSPATTERRQELVQRVRTMIVDNEISGIAGDLMAMAARPDSLSLLDQISCPTQIIVGELDLPTPPSDAKLMADRIPDARLTIIPGAAHLANLEQPELFNETVRSFVSTLASNRRG